VRCVGSEQPADIYETFSFLQNDSSSKAGCRTLHVFCEGCGFFPVQSPSPAKKIRIGIGLREKRAVGNKTRTLENRKGAAPEGT
jgi:hypothetical protein